MSRRERKGEMVDGGGGGGGREGKVWSGETRE